MSVRLPVQSNEKERCFAVIVAIYPRRGRLALNGLNSCSYNWMSNTIWFKKISNMWKVAKCPFKLKYEIMNERKKNTGGTKRVSHPHSLVPILSHVLIYPLQSSVAHYNIYAPSLNGSFTVCKIQFSAICFRELPLSNYIYLQFEMSSRWP